jgi:hypothetical protein
MNIEHSPLTLAVADWSVDPGRVVAMLAAEHRRQPSSFALLVPARLAGLAWTGDPHASRPCADHQLHELTRLACCAGVDVAAARVGDPEVVPAIEEALLDWPARRILLFDRDRRRPLVRPLSVSHRVERATRLPVSRIAVPDRPERLVSPTPLWAHRSLRCA